MCRVCRYMDGLHVETMSVLDDDTLSMQWLTWCLQYGLLPVAF